MKDSNQVVKVEEIKDKKIMLLLVITLEETIKEEASVVDAVNPDK